MTTEVLEPDSIESPLLNVKTMPAKESQTRFASIPTVKVGQGAVCFVESTQWAKGTKQSTFTGEQPRGRMLNGFFPSRSVQIPLTWQHRSETQLRNRSGAIYSNNWGTAPLPDKAVTSTEQRGRAVQYPGQALVLKPQSNPLSKGNNSTSFWTSLTHQGADH